MRLLLRCQALIPPQVTDVHLVRAVQCGTAAGRTGPPDGADPARAQKFWDAGVKVEVLSEIVFKDLRLAT